MAFKLKKDSAKAEPITEEIKQKPSQEPKQEQQETKPKEEEKELTVEDVLVNHENRIATLESTLYRLRNL